MEGSSISMVLLPSFLGEKLSVISGFGQLRRRCMYLFLFLCLSANLIYASSTLSHGGKLRKGYWLFTTGERRLLNNYPVANNPAR